MRVEQVNLSPRDVASIWFRHKLMIAVTFLLIAGGTAVVTMMLPNEYESRMKILVKGLRTDVPITPERTGGALGNVSDSTVSEAQINSEIELLTSKDLLNQVAKEAGLERHSSSLMERIGLKATVRTGDARVELAAERLGKELVITPVKKTNIIEVTYSSSSSQQAASVLQKLQELYLDKHLKLHRLPGTYEFFKDQASQYEQQLRTAEAGLSNFQRSMNVVSLNQQKDLTVQKMTETRSKLLETESLINEANERIALVQEQMRNLPPRIVTQTRALPNQYSAERLNTMLVELKNRRTQLLSKFRADDRLVREVDKQIETTKAALDRASGQTATEQATDLNPLRQSLEAELARVRIDRAGAQARQSTLSRQAQDYDNQLSRLESITGEYQDLTRRVKEAEDNYQLYEKKREEARIADELDQSKITNVSLAEAPVESHLPTKPNRPLNLILGIVLGALISLAAAVTAEFLRGNVETPRELEMLSGSHVLATIPVQSRDSRSLIIDKRRLLSVGNPPELSAEVNE